MPMPTFYELPPELFSNILSHVDSLDLQPTVLALTRAIPGASIPIHHLFTFIQIKRARQIILLNRRLRQPLTDNSYPGNFVREFHLLAPDMDADVTVNVIHMMPHLRLLKLRTSLLNFTPEHLETILSFKENDARWNNLTDLEIIFPPVPKATYLQFLRGSYFDSTLLTLSKWPKRNLLNLSIVQEPFTAIPELVLPTPQRFAQPIVFFKLDPAVSSLLHSPFVSTLKSFKFRLPGRQTARSLTRLGTMPTCKLTTLDLGTGNVIDTDVDMILSHYPSLEHLNLSGCPILRGAEGRRGEWTAFAKRCAVIGVRRAREKEKVLENWLQALYNRSSPEHEAEDDNPTDRVMEPRRVRRGRRGLATSTISLRESVPQLTTSVFHEPDTFPLTSRNALTAIMSKRLRIYPPSPNLKSLTVSSPLSGDVATSQQRIQQEWAEGWHEGFEQVRAARTRLAQSQRNGSKVLVFRDEEEDTGSDDESPLLNDYSDGWTAILSWLERHGVQGTRYKLWSADRLNAEQNSPEIPHLILDMES